MRCTLQVVFSVFEIHKIVSVWYKDSLGGVSEISNMGYSWFWNSEMSKPVAYSLDKILEIHHLQSSAFSKFVGAKAATLLKWIPP